MRIQQSVTAIAMSAIFCFGLGATKLGYDITKLPEGSSWSGTYIVNDAKGKIVFSSGIDIKILKRDSETFEGQWIESDKNEIAEIEGKIVTNKVTFKFTKEIQGKFPKGLIGGLEASGLLTVHDKESKLTGTTVNSASNSGNIGHWEVKLDDVGS